MDRVDGAAGEAAHHRAVDPDELQIVARVLLDEPHRALGPQRAHAVLDELGDATVVALDQLGQARPDPGVDARPAARRRPPARRGPAPGDRPARPPARTARRPGRRAARGVSASAASSSSRATAGACSSSTLAASTCAASAGSSASRRSEVGEHLGAMRAQRVIAVARPPRAGRRGARPRAGRGRARRAAWPGP